MLTITALAAGALLAASAIVAVAMASGRGPGAPPPPRSQPLDPAVVAAVTAAVAALCPGARITRIEAER